MKHRHHLLGATATVAAATRLYPANHSPTYPQAVNGYADGGPVNPASPTARAGNYPFIGCGQCDRLVAHFRKGGLQVAPGDLCGEDQPIGAPGNSRACDMPHLHIPAQRPGTVAAPFSGKPVPMRIDGPYLVRGDRP